MTAAPGKEERAGAPTPDNRRQWQLWITVGLLAAFSALVIWLIDIANESPDVWQRQIYVFTGVQAIVFTAVGWLFGREVNVSAAKAANANAEQAKSEAASARDEAHELRDQLTSAELKAGEERSKGRAAQAAVDGMIAAQSQLAADPHDVGLRAAHPLDAAQPINLTAVKTVLDQIYQ